MLKRRIEIEPLGRGVKEFIGLSAQRLCIVFASSALTFGVFDILHVRTVEDASALVRGNDLDIVGLPNRIRNEIGRISLMPAPATVERGDMAIAKMPVAAAPVPVAANTKLSPLAGLVADRVRDAVDYAMAPPVSVTAPSLATQPVSASIWQAVKLASIGTPAMPPDNAAPTVQQSLALAIPLDQVPLPRAAPGLPPPTPAQRLNLTGKERDKAEHCLANAIYFEARSEPVRGQMAVAQVVVNRAFSGFYPNDICGVVYQNASHHLACQFTFACDGKRKLINERGAWARAKRIARETLDGQIYVADVAKSTHYHATYVHPYWTREMKKLVRYGIHNFYRPYAWGNGADEPAWGSAAMADAKKK